MSRFSASLRLALAPRSTAPRRSLWKSSEPGATREVVATLTLVTFLLSQSVLPTALTLQSAQAAPRSNGKASSGIPAKTRAGFKTGRAGSLSAKGPEWYEESRRQEAGRRREIARGMKLLLAQAPASDRPATQTPSVTIQGLPGASALGALGRPRPVRQNLPGNIRPSAPLYVPNPFTTLQTLDLSGERVPTQEEVSGQGGACGALAPAAPAEPADVEAEEDQKLRGEGFEQGLRTALPSEDAPNLSPGVRAAVRRLEEGKKRVKAAKEGNREFALTMLDWNAGRFKKSVQDMEAYAKKHPKSPWVPEVLIHLADYAKFTAQPTKAQELYQQVMEVTSATPGQMSFEAHQKAYERWADLYLMEGRLSEARPMLEDLAKNDVHWRRRTWATYWLRQLNVMQNDRQVLLALRDCGVRALAMVFNDLGRNVAARRVAALRPPSERGFSLAQLRDIAAREGLNVQGFRARPAQLASLRLPLILHYAPLPSQTSLAKRKGTLGMTLKVGGALPRRVPVSGHFMIVRAVDARRGTADLLNPQDGQRSTLTLNQIGREWSGAGLLITGGKVASRSAQDGVAKVRWLSSTPTRKTPVNASAKAAPEAVTQTKARLALLSEGEMHSVRGTCYVVGPQGGVGNDPANRGVNNPCPPNGGSPGISVNQLTQNVFIEDTPLWYQPAKGPTVQITLSYNSQGASDYNTAYGNKWSFNYGSHIVEVPSTDGSPGRVTLFMPDGKQILFNPTGNGGYTSERGIFDTLTKTADKTFTLTFESGEKAFYGIPANTSSQIPLLLRGEDSWGQAVLFGYAIQNGKILLTTITDALGKVTNFSYDSSGRVLSVQDPFERHATFSYDGNGNLIECVDMEGNAFQYTYDDQVRVAQLNTAQGPWSFAYHDYATMGGHENSVTITNPLEKSEKLAWVGHNAAYFDHNGGSGIAVYGKTLKGSQTQTIFDDATAISSIVSPTGESLSYTYAEANDGSNAGRVLSPTSITDGRGKVTTITYNAQGEVTSTTNPKRQTTSFTYAANGKDIASAINANGVTVASATYNSKHQPLSATDINGTTSFSYTSWGDVASETSPDGKVTTYNYNQNGQLLNTIYDGVTSGTLTYDAVGRVKTETDLTGFTLTYEYNNLDKVTKVSYSDGTSSSITYACCDLPGMVIDRSGRKTYYDYDGLKRLVRVQDPTGNTLQMDYDANGNRVRLLDAAGRVTTWKYDAFNRLSEKRNDDGTTQGFAYSGGLLSQVRNERGQVTRYEYDDNTNIIRLDYPNNTDVTYTYNSLNAIATMTDGLGTSTYGYDNVGRPTSVDGPWQNDTQTIIYDAQGRLQSQSIERGTNGGLQTQSYGYDALERLKSLSSTVGGVSVGNFNWSYVGNTGMLAAMNAPNGTSTRYGYDALSRITRAANFKGAQTLNSYTYSYGNDNRDLRTGVEVEHGSDPLRQVGYNYDDANQLSGETATGGVAGTSYSNRFNYDATGNRTFNENIAGGNSRVTRSTANRLNQTTAQRTSTNGGSSATVGYGFDPSGNLTTQTAVDGSKLFYTYDDADRLQSIESRTAANVPQSKSEFVYDGASRLRISREFSYVNAAWSKTSEKRRVYNGLSVMQERDENNAVVASYTRSGDVGGILARSSVAGHAYYNYDASGNVVGITDQNGDEVAAYSYDAYGNTLSASGSYANQNPYRFSTKESLSGLIYFGFRFYSPGMGRWINRDPMQEAAGMNRYAFVANNPANLFDADGLSWQSFVRGFATGAGVGIAVAYVFSTAFAALSCAAPVFAAALAAIGAVVGAAMTAMMVADLWRLWRNEDNLCPDDLHEEIGNLLGGLVGGGAAARAGGRAGRAAAKRLGLCFVAGTLILMGDGSSKAIEQVKAGDIVLSKNEKSGKVEKQKVLDSWSKTAPATLLLTFADGTKVETTDEHPFFVEKAGFVAAKEIGIGSSIVTRAGPALRLTAKEVKAAPQVVYNFSVLNTNSYFVSGKGLWVHNAKRCGPNEIIHRGMNENHDGSFPEGPPNGSPNGNGRGARTPETVSPGVKPDITPVGGMVGPDHTGLSGLSGSPTPRVVGKQVPAHVRAGDLPPGLGATHDSPGHISIHPTENMPFPDYQGRLNGIPWRR